MLNFPFIAEALTKKDNQFLSNKRRNRFHTIDESSSPHPKFDIEDKLMNKLRLVKQFGSEYKLIHGYSKAYEGKMLCLILRITLSLNMISSKEHITTINVYIKEIFMIIQR